MVACACCVDTERMPLKGRLGLAACALRTATLRYRGRSPSPSVCVGQGTRSHSLWRQRVGGDGFCRAPIVLRIKLLSTRPANATRDITKWASRCLDAPALRIPLSILPEHARRTDRDPLLALRRNPGPLVLIMGVVRTLGRSRTTGMMAPRRCAIRSNWSR